jgi:8-oxo-dGTP diphosphatase
MYVATLCYLKRNGKTLMVKVNKANSINKGFWNGLGGKVEPNESPEECAIREIYEESGLTAVNPELKGVITFPDNNSTGNTWYVFVYMVRKFSGKLQPSPEGELHWIKDAELKNLKRHQADVHFQKWIDKNQIFSVKFNYAAEKLIDYQVKFY